MQSILIVDDRDDNLYLLEVLLKANGFEVRSARNGVEALLSARAMPPDLVVSDILMPLMDGYTLCREWRADESLRKIPFIYYTATFTSHQDEALALSLLADRFVIKPKEPDELMGIIRQVLSSAALSDQTSAAEDFGEEYYLKEYSDALFRKLEKKKADLEQANRDLAASEYQLRYFVMECPIPIAINDQRNNIELLNHRFTATFGYTRDDIPTVDAWWQLAYPDPEYRTHVRDVWRVALEKSRQSGEIINLIEEFRITCANGMTCFVQIKATPITNRLLVTFNDVTERKRYEERLFHQANYDSLTGLPNRYLLTSQLELLLSDARSTGVPFALLLMDIDHFKYINDFMGHGTGDEVLRQVAQRYAQMCNPGDLLARFVGDEFIIVRPGCLSVAEATDMALDLRQAHQTPFPIGPAELFITASAGIVLAAGEEDETPETLLKHAEATMYRAKKQGTGVMQIFSREISAEVASRLSLEIRLRRALEHEELCLYYQPQIDIAGGTVTGVEALLRWKPPEEALKYPADFMTILEETGLIVTVSEWVIHEVCHQARVWLDQGMPSLRVSVNITAWNLYSGKLLETVTDSLAEYGLAPATLCLEVTESMFMHDVSVAMKTLQRLHNLGVLISIDDFGTGYSSLSYLTRMPLHELKIDRAFIRDISHDATSAAIVTTVLSMAETLRLSVVAEGVETLEQYRFLAEHRCRTVQGFFFSRALPPEEIGFFITTWQPPTEVIR